jgi:hypothetical protein
VGVFGEVYLGQEAPMQIGVFCCLSLGLVGKVSPQPVARAEDPPNTLAPLGRLDGGRFPYAGGLR